MLCGDFEFFPIKKGTFHNDPFGVHRGPGSSTMVPSASAAPGDSWTRSISQAGGQLQTKDTHVLEVSPPRHLAERRLHRRCNMKQGLNGLIVPTYDVEDGRGSRAGPHGPFSSIL